MALSEQLALWDTEQDQRRQQSLNWQEMYDEFQASLNTPDEVDEYGNTFKQLICLRCGQASYYGTIHLNHDLGHCGCPTDHDPTWSKYEKAPGFQCVYTPDGDTRSMLTDEERLDRWDADKLPRCQCGCPFGLHDYGGWCGVCHPDDCEGYEANAPTTTH